jgi:hypothetical protein
MEQQTIERLQIKTAEQRFLSVLENDFHKPPRVAQALLEEAQVCLLGTAQHMRPGQMRVQWALVQAVTKPGLLTFVTQPW